MSKVTEYVVIIGVIVMIALSVFNRLNPAEPNGTIPAEVQRKLDSLTEENTLYKVNSAVMKRENQILEQEIYDLNEKLAGIKPKYIPIFKEYNNAGPERKKELVNSEYQKRLKERANDK